MRRELGGKDRRGDESFYYLDFDEKTGQFSMVIERIPLKGESYESSRPLHECTDSRYYSEAVRVIRQDLFKT